MSDPTNPERSLLEGAAAGSAVRQNYGTIAVARGPGRDPAVHPDPPSYHLQVDSPAAVGRAVAGRQQLAEVVQAAVERGDTILVSDFKITMGDDGVITTADVTDALLEAGADVRRAAEQDAEVRRLRAAGDPAIRSTFYDDGA